MIVQHTHWWTEVRDDCPACVDEIDGPAFTSICEICHSPCIGAWCAFHELYDEESLRFEIQDRRTR